jgi:hypothetical protein
MCINHIILGTGADLARITALANDLLQSIVHKSDHVLLYWRSRTLATVSGRVCRSAHRRYLSAVNSTQDLNNCTRKMGTITPDRSRTKARPLQFSHHRAQPDPGPASALLETGIHRDDGT